MTGILHGVRVLDVTRFVSGPISTALLADMGADVIRVEQPGGSDDRTTLPIDEGYHGGVGFTQLGRNKRGITLDLGQSEGRALFDRLLPTADVVVVNMPRRPVKALGLDYERLRGVKPDIIVAHLTTFGSSGPYSDRLGFDAIAQVMAGLTHISGDAGRPMKSNSAWVDMSTGFLTALGIVSALWHRQRTGEGQLVETNLMQTALTVGNYFLLDQHFNRTDRTGTGNRAQSGGPADLIETKDGWVYMVALGEPMFRRFMAMIGREDLIGAPRFASDELRAENGAELSAIVTEWAKQYDTAEVMGILEANRIPSGPLLTPQEALDDPHFRECFFQEVDIGLSRPAPYVRPPVGFSAAPSVIRHGPPTPGEHNAEIFGELSIDTDALATLSANGVI